MVNRPFWLSRIEELWKTRPIIWLSGVRRVGKTSLARLLRNATYLNCDLPSTERVLQDPEEFFRSLKPNTRIVFDEIHKLQDPSRVLKIGADEFPSLRLLATGSSTLHASKKFRDTLTGRKHTIHLPPVLWNECRDFIGVPDLNRRLLHGGLPEMLLLVQRNPEFYSEWIDSFYARDVQELFGIRNRTGFLKLFRLLLMQSGGLLEYVRLSQESDMSRITVKAHIEAMEIANAVYLLPPFHGSSKREIVKAPKCYAFDTGFVCYQRGWDQLRDSDKGILWEHLVLDALRTGHDSSSLHYWRDKSNREIDFVIDNMKSRADAIECKLNPDAYHPDVLLHFRGLYPKGSNFVVCPGIKTSLTRSYAGLKVEFCGVERFLFR